jgi:hypothetical protein
MDPKVETYMKAVIATFTAGRTNVEEAMGLMEIEMKSGPHCQQIKLLALRRYLRLGGARLVRQWAWTPAEAEKHKGETAALLAEAEAVAQVFAEQNPGLSLAISPIRDLKRQVYLWCKNKTVKQAAARLIVDARAKLAESEFLASPTPTAVSEFRSYLHHYDVEPEPSSAVPGTSDHGQQHAVDFVVKDGSGKPIADTETATIRTNWQNTGFDKKLKAATENTPSALERRKPILRGPLLTPFEPWHYALPKGERSAGRQQPAAAPTTGPTPNPPPGGY